MKKRERLERLERGWVTCRYNSFVHSFARPWHLTVIPYRRCWVSENLEKSVIGCRIVHSSRFRVLDSASLRALVAKINPIWKISVKIRWYLYCCGMEWHLRRIKVCDDKRNWAHPSYSTGFSPLLKRNSMRSFVQVSLNTTFIVIDNLFDKMVVHAFEMSLIAWNWRWWAMREKIVCYALAFLAEKHVLITLILDSRNKANLSRKCKGNFTTVLGCRSRSQCGRQMSHRTHGQTGPSLKLVIQRADSITLT
jgi:hypothetical protein